jgi:hypothetical protein
MLSEFIGWILQGRSFIYCLISLILNISNVVGQDDGQARGFAPVDRGADGTPPLRRHEASWLAAKSPITATWRSGLSVERAS